MGDRGPKPKAHALKVLHGDRHAARNAPPVPRAGEVKPPPGTSRKAQTVWKRLEPEALALGTLTSADLDMFRMLCDALVSYQAAQRELERDGLTVPSDRGGPKKHPAWQIARDAAVQVRQLAREFGMSASARHEMRLALGQVQRSHAERLLST